MGITRGGLNTKIHAVVDLAGNPVTLQFTAGQVADVTQAPVLTAELTEGTVVADKAYDSDPLRCALFEQGVLPCIPPRSNRKEKSSYGKKTYRKRHRVENFFARIKRFRRVATRYDKLTLTFSSFVYLASMLTFKKWPRKERGQVSYVDRSLPRECRSQRSHTLPQSVGTWGQQLS